MERRGLQKNQYNNFLYLSYGIKPVYNYINPIPPKSNDNKVFWR
jgi:hypothetical protein